MKKSAEVGESVRRVNCQLCQRAVQAVALYRVAGCDIVRCSECGLVFVPASSISTEKISEIYSRAYFEGGVPDGYADYSQSEDILRRQARRVLRMLRGYQPGGSLLEIGCAYGFFLLEAKEIYETEGLELSDFAAQQAQRRGLRVERGDFLEREYPPERFEVVCLFDCIEHLSEPFRYLRKIHDVLRPGGMIALTTGDIGSLYGRMAGSRWRLMTPPQHLYFFSRATLSRMLENAGFEVLRVAYPWKLVPWRLILYQLSPRLKQALGPLGKMSLGIYVNLFDAMLVLARKKPDR